MPEKVKEVFFKEKELQISKWEQELDELRKKLEDIGSPIASSSKYQEIQDKINQAKQSAADGEATVFSHLLTFFSRYYEEGDFISQRRYKGNTYAIPYNGEEVMLYWANKDQYYTKSGENFSNYRFKLDDGREVVFRLMKGDVAKDNRKDNKGERVFTLLEPYIAKHENEDGETDEKYIETIVENKDKQQLEIRFEYRIAGVGEKQKTFNQATLDTLKEKLGEEWKPIWKPEPTEKNINRTLLEKHLNNYTQKNTADYFIHKDLGGFLRQELDFYIKNEVMRLDDIQSAESFASIEQSLRQIQTIRTIAHGLIDFLAQLENFQKKLWLKKKFVVNTHYLITLDKIPPHRLPEIFANDKQCQMWQEMFDFNTQDIDLKAFTPPPASWRFKRA